MEETQAVAESVGYFAMGGYAEFVWPAYALTAIGLIGMVLWSVLRTRDLERRVNEIRRNRGQDA